MEEEEDSRLRRLTAELKEKNREAYDQFVNRTNRPDYKTDFYGEVKPFADRVQLLIDAWRPLADHWVKSRRPKYVYPIQIKDTYDNLAIVCVTAFQTDTRKRRFFETIKAVDYVLENMLRQID
ncbi:MULTISPECIES: YppE family protein [unclassified Sporolactobacillus]|uniref:YppE family protein n=1 Tax=unclassified Sporolactobacillus TaxID=2628533 RepID=UPI0023677A6B|nr:YppE family protein [Sporolactobacillus sp. CQH2019]MDD9148737.1 YppE family protein [Sporolactobacillus sp. CQH2019]